jgi:putative phage-type endonuclease
MQIHKLIQGTPAWHAYRHEHNNASDAPAMMGCSTYKTRTQLLHEANTGMTPYVDASTQRRFDDGHRFEALARPLAEEIIGEELYPVVGSDGKLSASFDGLTMMEDTAFEHKSLNDDLRAVMVDGCTGADLPRQYQVQMEQQCMVSGATRVLFMASKWIGDELVEKRHCWYTPNTELRIAIAAGWAQFADDLADFVPAEVMPVAIAAPVNDLPALSIRVDGALSLNHNLVLFGDKLQSFIADINTAPDDDQAFADAERAIKVMERAEEALGAAEASALGQISTVDDMVKTVAMYKEMARKTRLMLEKLVKTRKEAIRIEIQQIAKDKAIEHIVTLNTRLGRAYMPHIAVDFAGVMKGKKSISSLRDAVDTELARFKIEANSIADKIQINLAVMRDLAAAHAFLFADTGTIVLKATDDLTALVKMRIAEHDKAEAEKATALRAKIAEEERIKAEHAAAETVRLAKVEADRIAAESAKIAFDSTRVEAKRQLDEQVTGIADPAPAIAVVALTQPRILNPAAAWTPPCIAPSLRLGQISERLGFAMTAEFLRTIGFEPAGREKSAVLFHEAQFPLICAALIQHIQSVCELQAA